MNTDTLFSVAQYARLRKLAPQRIYQLIEEGKVKVKVIAGRKFVDLRENPLPEK